MLSVHFPLSSGSGGGGGCGDNVVSVSDLSPARPPAGRRLIVAGRREPGGWTVSGHRVDTDRVGVTR